MKKFLKGLLLIAVLVGGGFGFLIWLHNERLIEGAGELPALSESAPTTKAASAASAPKADAVKWVKVSTNTTFTIYLDPAVSARVGTNIMIWLLREYNQPQFDGTVNYLSSKDQIEVDCSARRVRRIYSSNHPQPMGGGDFVSSEHGPMSWNDVPQDSIIRRAIDIACMNS